jgi:predicted transcriptional regulator
MPWLGGRPWTRKLGIRVDEDRVRRIKIVAAARGATMEELLVEAIDQYMERHWPEVSRGLR